jgi:hypothetical protein
MTRSIYVARPRVKECRCIKVNTVGRSELAPSLGHMIFLENLLKYLIILNADKFNPFHSNFSVNLILPSSYLFWAVKRLVDYL